MLGAIVTRGLRVLTLGVASALLAGAAVAGPADDASAEARETRHWLARIHAAAAQRNFLGTFVVSTGAMVASARIAHYCSGSDQFERIESLDGRKRQVLRHNDEVADLWPVSRVAVIGTRRLSSEFPALLSGGIERIAEHYSLQSLGEGRVAGHEAQVLLLRPRDAYRWGHRLWAEKRSGLLLRAEVLDEREAVLEAAAFTDLIIGVKPQPELVLRAMRQLDGYRIERAVFEPAELEAEGWQLRAAPPGFGLVSSVRRPMAAREARPAGPAVSVSVLQSIWSDGLTHVSVFIEPYAPAVHQREALVAQGATHTLMRRQGDWWITVVGDVPAATLRSFAVALERQR